MGRRVATYRAARTRTATEREEHDGVGGGRGGTDGEEDRDVDADVVAAVGEGHGRDGPDRDGLARVFVVVTVVPRLPGGVDTEKQGDQPEVGDGAFGQKGVGAQGDQDRGHEDGTKADVLPRDDLGGGAGCAATWE